MTDIGALRETIDRLDAAIITLFAEREAVVRRIVRHKDDETAVRGANRVAQVIGLIRDLAKQHGLKPSIAEAIYRTVIHEFTELQLTELRNKADGSGNIDVVSDIQTNDVAQERRAKAGYAIAKILVYNQDWLTDYSEKADALIATHGGKYVVRGGRMERLEGEDNLPSLVVLLKFPSMAAAKAWHSDPEYQSLIENRNTGSTTDFILVEGA